MELIKIRKNPQLVVSITKEMTNAEVFDWIGESFMKLADHIEREKAQIAGLPFVSFKKLDENGNIAAAKVMIEIGIPIDHEINDTIEIICYQMAGYKAIQGTFTGSDDDLALVYSLMIDEIKKGGREFMHQSYEYYLTDASANAEEQMTMLEIPYR
ncbi:MULTISPECIES: GyrI-like domain-containing protein [Enterococcus]|uniref:GyrI-like domain-containing protein n=1 Tax=Enterococcus TaxID=1350 RepID=UPI00065E2DDC|nr:MULTISPECIES: GyrI-like domain-containing protein [Enterococcus]KAF1304685.1 hypothetical protein BAU16_00500 [Enterococcus sp. JM9B]